MLYIGEGCNKMFLVNDGKVIWTYSTGKGWEYDDIWLLSNGNILFSRMHYAAEVTPQKKVVWRLDAPKGTEIHTVQPIGLDKVLLVENGTATQADGDQQKTGAVEVESQPLPCRRGVHGQFRRFRMTANGTYLAPFLEMDKVIEYDKRFQRDLVLQHLRPGRPSACTTATRSSPTSGTTLTREVNPKGETVWEFNKTDLPPSIKFSGSQSCVRLANGNTVLCSRGDGGNGCQLLKSRRTRKSSGRSKTGPISAPPAPSRCWIIRASPKIPATCSADLKWKDKICPLKKVCFSLVKKTAGLPA